MTPPVMFVCVRNGGKSQMAGGLMRNAAGGRVVAHPAGTDPGEKINALSAQALAEVGVDIAGEVPASIDPHVLRTVDVVVTLGREAKIDVPEGVRFQNWEHRRPNVASRASSGCVCSAMTSTTEFSSWPRN